MADRNFILAIVLSIFVLMGWQYFFGVPQMEKERVRSQGEQASSEQIVEAPGPTGIPQVGETIGMESGRVEAGRPSVPEVRASVALPRDQALAQSPRVRVETPRLSGSVNLMGGRIDDIALNDYRETVEPDSPKIVVLSPDGVERPYYAQFGWTAAAGADLNLPDRDTVWTAASPGALTPDSPLNLWWDNGAGLRFESRISVDEDFLFTITQSVTNKSGLAVTLYPYGLISRTGTPEISGFFILHEGLLGVLDGNLEEIDYEDLREEGSLKYGSTGGWLGITDKYWMTALAPDQNETFSATFNDQPKGTTDVYRVDYLFEGRTVSPGARAEATAQFFAGAKEVSVIDRYEEELGIESFDLAIDWGWFYFLTKPFFLILHAINGVFGNFGIAILLLTVLVKLVFFPLANQSYVAMAKMKNLQPEMVRIREVYEDDKVKQQQEMMALYQKEKVNPLAGCLPMVIQIPVFFALYKVLFVTIEMRHAPFFGWIRDLAAPDPTSIFNLFGLIPWDPPSFLMIGVWPILMGMSMFVQNKMNPAPADPVQQKVFAWMPVFFVFILYSFPAGLVIYWVWNNLLSILQQYVIMRRQGVEIELFKNIGWLDKLTERISERDKGSGSSDS